MPTPRRKPTAGQTPSTESRPPRRRHPAAKPDDVVVLAGPPGRLATTVTVANLTADRLVVRRPTLHLEGRAVTGGLQLGLVTTGSSSMWPPTSRST